MSAMTVVSYLRHVCLIYPTGRLTIILALYTVPKRSPKAFKWQKRRNQSRLK
jgi:L-ascorbate metabolism protein UlaG (beta-lactamase superfamily)